MMQLNGDRAACSTREIIVSATARAEALDAILDILEVPRGLSSFHGAWAQDDTSFTEAVPLTPYRPGARARRMSAEMAHKLVRRGVPSCALVSLGDYLGLGNGAMAELLDLDRATVQRKVAKGELLPAHATESVLRLLELDRLAEETLTSPEEAAAWLRRPHPMLDGETPLECAKSAFGTQCVKDILVAARYGGVV